MTFESLIDKFQNDPSSEVRRQAADDLISNQMINQISITAFATGLLDSDVGIRDVCQRALLEAPDEYREIVATSVAPYINMREIEVRNLASEILTKLGRASIQTLLPYLKSSDFDVRKFACDILGLIADSSISSYIIPLLSDTDRNVQISAVETLGNLQASDALDALIMVYENFEEIKPAVIESIGKIGGDNSEAYLLEQLDNETDQFLLTTIIDALSFNAKSIDISYKLLMKMPTANAEMQKIMLMTSFAISFRLGKVLIMPDELRYVSHLGMMEHDENIMIASLISLGSAYRSEDVAPLINVISNNLSEYNKQIMYNLTMNSSTEEITYFFQEYFDWEERTKSNSEVLEYLSLFWYDIPLVNKEAIIAALITNFELTGSRNMIAALDMLYQFDKELIATKLIRYSKETSENNKILIEEFINNH